MAATSASHHPVRLVEIFKPTERACAALTPNAVDGTASLNWKTAEMSWEEMAMTAPAVAQAPTVVGTRRTRGLPRRRTRSR